MRRPEYAIAMPRRHQAEHDVAAVERRHGNQVEKREQQVDPDRVGQERHQGIRLPAFGEVTSPQQQRGGDRLQHVTDRTSGGDDHEIAAWMPQVTEIHRHRLRPPDQRQVADRRNQRQQHGADPVDMDQRIQRDASQHPRGRIAELVGGPRVRGLVNRQRNEEYGEADGDGEWIDIQRRDSRIRQNP